MPQTRETHPNNPEGRPPQPSPVLFPALLTFLFLLTRSDCITQTGLRQSCLSLQHAEITGVRNHALLLSISLKKKKSLFYMNGCFAGTHSCTPHACSAHTGQKRASYPLGLKLQSPCRCWGLNSGPTNKGLVLLPAKPSFQPLLHAS